ncbi:hypothetical protein GLYMA_18G301400v4 [Glycine max]|nr:hypothetical protein GLYMA_18G301400v4 [Glycine max]KAH1156807.1 hypothetical protein GYH30_051554 [Glycine max]
MLFSEKAFGILVLLNGLHSLNCNFLESSNVEQETVRDTSPYASTIDA